MAAESNSFGSAYVGVGGTGPCTLSCSERLATWPSVK